MRLKTIEDFYPLAPMQHGMLFHSLYAPSSGVYVEQLSCVLHGNLNVAAFERAWQQLIDRYPILRTGFVWEGLDEPVQMVHRRVTIPLEQQDWRGIAQPVQPVKLESFLQADKEQGFDVTKAPLLRFALFRIADDAYYFVWSFHHILLDGWSVSSLLEKAFACYHANTKGQELRLEPSRSYRDYIVWLRQQDEARAEAFWRRMLHGITAPTQLGVERAEAGDKTGYDEEQSQIDAATSAALQSLARQQQVTLSTLFQGAWALVLSRYSSDQDVVFGVTVSGRPPTLAASETMIGLFINTLPLRVSVDPRASLRSWLESLQAEQVEMRQYEYSSLVQVQGWSEIPRGTPLFDNILVFENYPMSAAAKEKGELLPVSDIHFSEQSNYPLTVVVEPGSEITLKMSYDQRRFSASAITRLLRHFQNAITSIVGAPEQRVGDVQILDTHEHQHLIVDWNQTQASYALDKCVHELVEAQVARTPEAIALVFEAGTRERVQLTYDQLNRRANQVAHHLRALGIGPDARVGLCFERSPELLIGLLGVHKAGGAYVPLDPSYPQDRLAYMLDDAGIAALLTTETLIARLPQLSAPTIRLDADWSTIAQQPTSNPRSGVTPDNLAYVIYTSGSTGRPKGVMNSHRAIGNRLLWNQEIYPLSAADRVLQIASFSFDISLWELVGPLLAGAQVIMGRPGGQQDSGYLVQLIAEQQITIAHFVPSLLQVVLDEPGITACDRLRGVFCGGEALPKDLPDRFFARLNADLLQFYGPTEASINATYWAFERGVAQQGVPIGCPIANTQIYLLDNNLQPVPVGVPGELHIGGDGLARGYTNRPEQTADKFIPDPFARTNGARLYRTGDLARYRADGVLEFVGRIDHQLKIRGFRVELGEIEAVIVRHPEIREAVVVAEQNDGDTRLIAYVVENLEPRTQNLQDATIGSTLRAYLAEYLPDYMIPAVFVQLDALPLNPNGKLDRKALPAPESVRVDRDEAFVAPRTPTEETIAGIWAAMLKQEHVGIHDTFFALGGHSLLATQIMSRVRSTLEVDLPLGALFESPTVAGLAARVEAAQRAAQGLTTPVIERVSREQPLPLSFAQQRLWFLDQLQPNSAAYNIPAAVQLSGTLQVPALHSSLNAIVARHEALRTTFAEASGDPIQVIAPTLELELPTVDLSARSAIEQELAVLRHTTDEAQTPFDLTRGPLIRAKLLQLGEQEHVLLVTVHHIVSDGWSVGVFLRELVTFYDAFVTNAAADAATLLPALPIQYADYAVWQRGWLAPGGEILEKQLGFWKQQLGGGLPLLELPTDHPRPAVQSFKGARHTLALPKDLTQALNSLSQREGVTLYMTLLAAFQTLLHHYTRQNDLVIGTPTAGRTQPETENLIGFFINTLVLRTDLSGNPSFKDLLKRVRKVALEAQAHQDIPFEQLVDAIQPQRDLSRSALFQVLFVLQNAPMPGQSLRDLTLTSLEIDNGTAKFDIALDLTETGDGLGGFIEYSTDLFETTTIERMAEHFQSVLESIVGNPEQRVADVTILPAAERQQLLVDWNATTVDYPQDVALHTLIEAQVARTPKATALVFEGQQLTYAELNTRANQLAQHLRTLGVGPETRVAVCMERSLELVIALIGVLKAGGAYVPVDPSYPTDRIQFMLADAAAPVLLTQQRLEADLPPHSARVLRLDADWSTIAQAPTSNPVLVTDATNLAYMIYTSGSTGQPKGAMNTHQAIVNRLLWMQDAFGLTAADRVLQKTPFSFDVSVWEFFWPLLIGATLVVATPGGHQDSAYLVDLIAREQITTLHFVPSMLQVFLEEQQLDRCQALRRVICSGEALPLALQERFFSRLSAQLHNLYGPTEAAVDVTWWPCQPHTGLHTVPIGRAIANTQIYILDAQLRPVPIGVPGELHIGGIQLARGYHGRPALTAEKFIPDPFSDAPNARLYKTGDLARFLPDGAIEYLGRLDFQVKVRGFRIELGEIETALGQHPQIREVVVVARQDVPGETRLVAYLVENLEPRTQNLEAGPDGSKFSVLGSDSLRRFLQDKLPEYMIPAAFVTLDALPLSPNGKVDRKALPAPDTSRPELEATFVAPRTPEEQTLAEIWQLVLGLERVGIHDNFFALGGDSMRSIRVLSQARDRGLSLSLQQLFQHQTIEELARTLGDSPTSAGAHQRVEPFSLVAKDDRLQLPGDVEDAYPLGALQVGMLFHSEYNPDSAVYHDIFTQHIRMPFNADAMRSAIRELAARHEILRTSFDLTNYSQPLQLVHRLAAPEFEVEDLRYFSATEQQAAIVAWMEEDKRRPFEWRRAPLLRIQIHRRTDDDIQFTVSFHHAILDGWSLAAMNTELFTLYFAHLGQAAPTLAAPPTSGFRDFIALEQQALSLPETREYWTRTLADSVTELIPRWPAEGDMPSERQIRTQSAAVDEALSDQIKRLAQQTAVPLKSVLLAAHLRVLSLLHGRGDVLSGLVSHGRPETEDGERILGMFLNTLPFRLELRGGSWLDLIRATFDAERELLPHRWYPMAEIQRNLGGQQLFETAFNYVDFYVYQSLGGLSGFRPMGGQFFQETNFTLSANFSLDQMTGAVQLGVEYDASQIPDTQAQAIAEYYARALTAMVTQPHARYDRDTLLSDVERRRLLVEWNATETAYPQSCAHLLFEAQVERRPDVIALAYGELELSYHDLNTRANQLAWHLRSLGVRPESRVAICLERSPQMIVGLLGIWKAGGVYVPLDPAYPQDRLHYMLQDSGAAVLLMDQSVADYVPEHSAQVVRIDADWPTISQNRADNPTSGVQPDNLAYIIYTSGSTGKPKGVLVPHRGLGNLAGAQIRTFGVTPESRVLQFASFSFDASVSEICMALLAGATLSLGTQDSLVPGPAALQVLREQAITTVTLPPSVLAVLTPSDFPALQTVIAAGEACPPNVVERWRAPVNGRSRSFFNAYGPTETTVCATIAECRDGKRKPPIGHAIDNLQVYVLNQDLQPTPIGLLGEIYVGGVGVVRGYNGRPDLTAERFVPDPFSQKPGARLYRTGDQARYLPSGELEYTGRIDHQVKVRGFRIELGEIEAALRQHEAVRDAVVIVRDETGDKRIVAYVVGEQKSQGTNEQGNGEGLTPELRRFLLASLPEYMIPAAFVTLDALPLTPNGKVDRRALPAPDNVRSEQSYVAPRTPTEETVARILAEILVVDRVGAHDNFFELGGHSLLAMQLISRLRHAFQVELPLRVLYESATVADLARTIVQQQAEQADTGELDEMLAELDQLSDEEVQALLASGEGLDE